MSSPSFVLGNKPSGVTTHQSESYLPGYQEWLSHELGKKLYVCHRLDKETTGSILFATTPTAAAQLTEEFTQSRVDKEYLFLTDKKPKAANWVCNDALLSSKTNKPQTAETSFEIYKEMDGLWLLRAFPKTGRTHQVRIHAANSGVPLLGDIKYGGTNYPHFFLHCARIQVQALNIDHSSPAPLVMTESEWIKNSLLTQWLMSVDRRERLYGDKLSRSAYRWIHDEGTPLRLDMLGGKGCAGWWRDSAPNENEFQTIEQFFKIIKCSEWRLMHYSGQRTQDKPLADSIQESSWLGRENNLQLEFRKESGLSCGLFLDQRDNRQWTHSAATKKTVLNLFAYTGAFSAAAALGGASKVTTVDLSKNYIDWCKENFKCNKIDVETHGFYSMDALEYLKYAQKKQLQFDVIICDPPSFSRDKKGRVFRIEKDFPTLVNAACSILSPDGVFLFSTNYEKWTAQRWKSELEKCTRLEDIEITEKLSFVWDFETSHNRHMKAFLFEKK